MLRPSFAATTRRRWSDSGERRTLTVLFSAGAAADFGGAIAARLCGHMFDGGCINRPNPLVTGPQRRHVGPVRGMPSIMLHAGPRHVAFAPATVRRSPLAVVRTGRPGDGAYNPTTMPTPDVITRRAMASAVRRRIRRPASP